jgi:hypothetical protein
VPQYATVLKEAATQAAAQRFFHWDLEFPEVFFDRYGQPLGAHASIPKQRAKAEPLNRALRWLESHGLVLLGPHENMTFEPALNDLARYLGDNYLQVARLHKAIKQSFPNRDARVQVDNVVRKKERRVIQAFCGKLQRYGLATSHGYNQKDNSYSVDLSISWRYRAFYYRYMV